MVSKDLFTHKVDDGLHAPKHFIFGGTLAPINGEKIKYKGI
jgi:hypothetical protein